MNKVTFGRFSSVVSRGRGWLLCVAALLASCGGGGSSTPVPASPSFELRLGAESVPVHQDSSGLLHVRVQRKAGFTDAVLVTLADPPEGISASAVVVEPYEDEASLPLRLRSDVPLGAQTVIISGSGGGATAAVNLQLDVQTPRPNSGQLIADALAAGQIDLGTSLLYRAYAVFGDSRLPEAFVGSGPAEEDMALFTEIEDARATLPKAILDQLTPYLVRPDDPASVFNAGQPTQQRQRPMAAAPAPAERSDRCPGGRREWITLRSALHPVRAWALCDSSPSLDLAAQNHLLRVIAVVDKAYGGMVSLMGPAKADLWGDEAIDIYVVPTSAHAPRPGETSEVPYMVGGNRGAAWPQAPFVGRTSSAFMMMPRWRLGQNDYQLTLIHELFHVLQFAHNYRLGGYWFSEASAVWASVHFNRTARIRPDDNAGLHGERFKAYQASGHGLLNTAGQNAYFSYIWPMFMEFKGGFEMIGGAWRQLAGATTAAQATNDLDFVFPFKDNLLDFAWRNLNQEYQPGDGLPRIKRYVKLDPPFPDKQHPPMNKSRRLSIHESTEVTLDLRRGLESLSAGYYEAEVTDPDVKQVVFELDAIQIDGLIASALVNIDGTWESEPRSLDGKRELRFCLDRPAEKLKEIVIIVANHLKDPSGSLAPGLVVKGSPLPCQPVWEGTVTTRWSRSSSLAGNFEATTTATIAFEYDPTALPVPDLVPHRLRGGAYTHNARLEQPARNPPCRTTERTSGIMGLGPLHPLRTGSTTATLDLLVLGPRSALYLGSGATAVEMVQTSNCNDRNMDETITLPGMTITWWAMQMREPLSEDGKTIEGSLTSQDGLGGTVTQSWRLTRRNE
jgi:hypothetical protein